MKYAKNGVLWMFLSWTLTFNCQIAVLDFKLGSDLKDVKLWSYVSIHFWPCIWNYILRDIFKTTSCGCQINKVKICNICIIEKANLFEILWKYKEGISTLLFFNLTETCLRRILKAYPRILNKHKTCANLFLTPFSFKRITKSYQRWFL